MTTPDDPSRLSRPREEGLSSPLEVGTVVGGKLRLDGFLARGGMGSVWTATHLVLASQVAIKFLDRVAHDIGDGAVDRFRFEAQISARLASQTQHMVAVHDAGVHDGMPYLVMELAPGKSLQDLLDDRGRIDPSTIVQVVEQIGQALDAAHRAGIVHRDVKPGNILFLDRRPASRASLVEGEARDLFVKLTDFGVAKPLEGSAIDLVAPRRTTEGLVVGSPAYMSPEQIAATTCHGASDRWALGVVIYECLTGWLPFRGESLTDFALAITARPHDSPSTIVDELPRSLDAFFDRALAKRPEDRFATCAEMASALREALEARPHPVVPERRRTPLWTAALVAAGVAAIGLFLFLVALGGSQDVGAAPRDASSREGAASASPVSASPPAPAASLLEEETQHPPGPPSASTPSVRSSRVPRPASAPPAPPASAAPPSPRPQSTRPVDPSDIH